MIPPKTRSVIIVIRGTGTGGAVDPLGYVFKQRCKLKAVEALNATTAASYNAVYLRLGDTGLVCGLHPSHLRHSYWNGAADAAYNELTQQTRVHDLDIIVDGTFELVADFYATVAADELWLKILIEVED